VDRGVFRVGNPVRGHCKQEFYQTPGAFWPGDVFLRRSLPLDRPTRPINQAGGTLKPETKSL
jgi:hypothetical protein